MQVLARAVRPASAERVRPAANVSGNWTNVAMGPWLTKRSSVASYCPAANRSVSADIVAAALQARHICSRRHAGQTVPLRAQNGSSARRLDRASERADPMTFHSLRGRPSKPANQFATTARAAAAKAKESMRGSRSQQWLVRASSRRLGSHCDQTHNTWQPTLCLAWHLVWRRTCSPAAAVRRSAAHADCPIARSMC